MPVRTGKEGTKHIIISINACYDQRQREIHVTSDDDPDRRFHVRVRNDPDSTAHHAALYGHLRRLLEQAGRWPEGATS